MSEAAATDCGLTASGQDFAIPDIEHEESEQRAGSLGATVADICNELHDRAQGCAESAITFACEVGAHLIAQKEELPHGEFKKWIESECDFSYSSAKAYMKASRQKDRGLSFSSLAQALNRPSDDEPQKKDKDDAERQRKEAPTALEHEIHTLNVHLEGFSPPPQSAEQFIAEAGVGFLTDKARDRLHWLVNLYMTMLNISDNE